MLKKADIEQFYKEVEKLDLKFPVASIARATDESDGNVSKILNRKLDPSESFLKRFYEKFPKTSKNVSRETDLQTALDDLRKWQATVDATLSVLMAEIVPLLKDSTGKSSAGVFSQLKRDIEVETQNRLAVLKREG